MNQRFEEAGKAGTTPPYPLRLASRTDLPPRPRASLDATFAITRRYPNDTLARALEEFQRELLKLSENARDTTLQQNYFQSTRALFSLHSHLAPRYVEDLEDSFASYDRRAHANAGTIPSREALSLIEANELEESLAVQEFIARNEVHYSQALYELGHRFAVLVALPMLEPRTIPAGPQPQHKPRRPCHRPLRADATVVCLWPRRAILTSSGPCASCLRAAAAGARPSQRLRLQRRRRVMCQARQTCRACSARCKRSQARRISPAAANCAQ